MTESGRALSVERVGGFGSVSGGIEIVSSGHCLPEAVLSNADLETMMDTTDEWIVQRTGISERRIAKGDECTRSMASAAGAEALRGAGMRMDEIDLVLVATVTAETPCPSVACRVLDDLRPEFGSGNAGAFDLAAACSGFVYCLNIGHDLLRCGSYRSALVIGAEHLTQWQEYRNEGRGTAILFGDAAGAAVLRRTDSSGKGVLAQRMHSDGSRWVDLFMPNDEKRDFPGGVRATGDEMGVRAMRMNGRGVFKFAVSTFGDVIEATLKDAGVTADDVDLFLCHQSNVRILDAARDRFGIPPEKVPVNIHRVGNTSAASVPLLLHEQRAAGAVGEGKLVMFVAFGGGLTWTTSLWQM